MQLNNAGYAISGSSSDGDTYTFKYDGANGLISGKYSEYEIYTYRWNDGNRLIESSTVDPSSEYKYIQTYILKFDVVGRTRMIQFLPDCF